jgi:1-acyl-sn-glycerol-3-phosphate acyltransferase
MKRGTRAVFRFALLFSTALQACVDFFLLRTRGPLSCVDRVRWLHRWCALALRRLEIDVTFGGAFPSHGLLVANHLSYLDILAFSALAPCAFVAKREVRSWPLFGWMARMAGTVFVDRNRARDAHHANVEVQGTLSDSAVVVLFPEGTSSNGATVLPFRPALFQAAVSAKQQITSAHIQYQIEQGSAADDVCYWGSMTFLPHLLQLLSKGAIRVRVSFAAGQTFTDRKKAAATTREIIVALGQTSQEPSYDAVQRGRSLTTAFRPATAIHHGC